MFAKHGKHASRKSLSGFMTAVLVLSGVTALSLAGTQVANAGQVTPNTITVNCDPLNAVTTGTISPTISIWPGEKIQIVSATAVACANLVFPAGIAAAFTGATPGAVVSLTNPSQVFTVDPVASAGTVGDVPVYTTNGGSDYGIKLHFVVGADACTTQDANWFSLPDGSCAQDIQTYGSTTNWVVPTGATSVHVTVTGGTGDSDSANVFSPNPVGGRGNEISANIAVTAGDLIAVMTQSYGTMGGACVEATATAGPAAYSGGAASITLNTNQIIAGGGGSAGCSRDGATPSYLGGTGGDAGLSTDASGQTGGSGQVVSYVANPSTGGAGGTASAGGSQGKFHGYGTLTPSGTAGGSLAAGSPEAGAIPGGAGGSGYFGGGAGGRGDFSGSGGGGGGGSSYIANGGSLTNVSERLVRSSGHGGLVRFSWLIPKSQTVTWAPTSTYALTAGGTVTPSTGASSDGPGAITYAVVAGANTTSNCSLTSSSSDVITVSTAGTCEVKATAAASGAWTTANTTVIFTFILTTQTITWAPNTAAVTLPVTSFTPSANAVTDGTGAITYTVTGGTSNCSFATSPSSTPTFNVTTAGTCTITATAAANGVWDLGTASATFTFNNATPPPPPPGSMNITSLSPNRGSVNGGTTVLIRGIGFANRATVKFGGKNALVLRRVGTTQILVWTPSHAAGLVAVLITNPDNSYFSGNLFTYVTNDRGRDH